MYRRMSAINSNKLLFTMKRNSLLRPATLLLTALSLVFVTTSCKKDDEATPNTVTDVVIAGDQFTLLEAAVVRAGLADALKNTNNITVFAPTDAAFRAAGFADVAAINATPVATLTSVLQYHVLASRVASSAIQTADNAAQPTLLTTNGTIYITRNAGGVSVNGARVTQPDVAASNGVIHVIDRVLLPPAGNLLQAIQALSAANNNNFSLLIAAATRVGGAVITTLSTAAGPFTLFAPTNAAFTAAGFANEAAINAASVATLQAVLLNHVVAARAFSTNLASGSVNSAGGGPLAVVVGASGVTVTGRGNGTNASNVTAANVVATNGVIHVIDRVLLP